MAWHWNDFLELARDLAERSDESSLRTAISRAYYAALGVGRAFLISEGRELPEDNSLHAAVWQSFYSSSDDRRYYIAIDGRWLRTNRNEADYDEAVDNLPLRARQSIKKAHTLIAAIERLRSANH